MRTRAIVDQRYLRRVTIPVLGLFIVLIMCFGEEAESNSDESAISQHQIVITGFKFIPPQLEVSLGDTITWINKDIVPHNIAVESGQQILSPELSNGEIFTMVAEASLSYLCGLHPTMKGEIVMINLPESN